jgi:putative ABC transport system substrate-binding protein
MSTTVDPVETGLVNSLAQPGGNLTGVTRLTRELSGKRLELLKEVLPKLSRVGVLWDAGAPGPAIAFKEYEVAARTLKVPLQSFELRGPNPEFEKAFPSIAKARANAVIIIRGLVFNRYPTRIGDLAIKSLIPTLCEGSDYVEAGGLMSYASNDADSFRRLAVYVDKILRGTKPGDLPVEQPMKFELVFNLKTAKQIGVTIPQWTLMKADRVIR